tara:strand:- start:615 stop:1019 length:405 start_codon:yes stop_codon:yes gene_type:complete
MTTSRATRPGEIWATLCLFGLQKGIPEDVLFLIQKIATNTHEERQHLLAFEDKRDREKRAVQDAQAEEFVHSWKLFGCASLLDHIQQKRAQAMFERQKEAALQPLWIQLGFSSMRSYNKSVKLSKRLLVHHHHQ